MIQKCVGIGGEVEYVITPFSDDCRTLLEPYLIVLWGNECVKLGIL